MIDSQEVDRVIELAQLAIGDDERAQLAGELAAILDYVQRLREVEIAADSSAAKPDDSNLAATRLRDDVVAAPLSREAALSNAPSIEAGLFRLPRLLD